MKEKILEEIKRLAAANGGQAPGARAFGERTGIRESAWRGVYWARWNDAVSEAGVAPNATSEERRISDNVMFAQLAEAYRRHGHIPTVAEFRLYRRQNPDFPDFKTIERRFNGFKDLPSHVRAWVADREEFADVAKLLGSIMPGSDGASPQSKTEGSVYLLQSGAFFKIGRSDDLERRVKEIRTALPDTLKLVHTISTDDPSGIEAYWHRRFADRRANGEWFKLSAVDVAAFKRRRFQ